MADPLSDTVSVLIEHCPHVISTRNLVTKVRLELKGGYLLDLFFRDATSQYAYTLTLNTQRLLGWDNSPHYPELPNALHHVHRSDGSIQASSLIGDPPVDRVIVAQELNTLLGSQS
jgi:hypothetical protein